METLAEAVLGVALESLSSFIQKEFVLYRGFHSEMESLTSQLTHIKDLLEDADEKQITNKALKDWLRKLRDEAHLLDDIFDEWATHALSLEYQPKEHPYCFCSFKPSHVMFRRKMAKQLKVRSDRINGIFKESERFGLRQRVRGVRSMNGVMDRRETTSTITQPHFYGRDAEKQKIVDFLVGDASNLEDLLVYPIVGIGGLGKTAFTQRVYHDERVVSHFELRLWVCVSDDFSIGRLLKAIIESAQQTSGYSTLEALHKQVQDLLGRKRYLLILDDVWNDNRMAWDNLKSVLACGSKGASILLTTRQDNVANITTTIEPLHLSLLSEDDCWEVFKQQALVPPNEGRAELVHIGKEIVKKCKGVPLAAKTLGSLLRSSSNEEDWKHIKDSEIWNLPPEKQEEPILPALRLSYLNLSAKLRQCFAYLSVFPKDEVMSKKHVIELWMANGFISTIEERDVELDGDRVWNELNSKSFFEDVSSDISLNEYEEDDITFKMHDLFHDVAQFVTDKECCSKTSESGLLDKRPRHMSISGGGLEYKECSSHCSELKSLKSLIVLWNDQPISPDIFLKCSSLRVLQRKFLKEVPPSINQLKHLRYLNLSGGWFTTLPDSICRLWNLLILNLNDCKSLQKLPDQLKCLKSLHHLHLEGCSSLSKMAPGMGELAHLKTLHTYIVGVKKGLLLEEIGNLKLEGTLHIQHLERVISVMDGKKANLAQKRLNKLKLSWEGGEQTRPQENEEILEVLQPHKQLKILVIRGYLGAHLPQWMVNPMLNDLSHLELGTCRNVVDISFLAKLPSLKGLELSGMDKVQYIDDECYVEGVERGFQALEQLTLEQLQGLVKFSREDGGNMFPRLSTLSIDDCHQLQFPFLPSVTTLKVSSGLSRVLLASIQNLPNLESLDISDDGELTSFPDDMLGGLKNLYIWDFPKLEALPSGLANFNALQELQIVNCDSLEAITEEVLRGLSSLKSLYIWGMPKFKLCAGFRHLIALEDLTINGCPEVEDLHDALQHLTSLKSMTLYDLPNLASLPHWLGNLGLLEKLVIIECPKLTSLPISIQSLSNLKTLEIWSCPELAKRCKEGTGEDWHLISHVPHRRIEELKHERCVSRWCPKLFTVLSWKLRQV